MDPQTTDFLKYIAAVSVPVAASILTLILTNRHNRKQASDERTYEELRSREESIRNLKEQRYQERRNTYSRLISIATTFVDDLLNRDWEGKPTLDDVLEGPELSRVFRPLHDVLGDVLLIGSEDVRKTAPVLVNQVERFAGSDNYSDFLHAVEAFQNAARADLGIEEGS